MTDVMEVMDVMEQGMITRSASCCCGQLKVTTEGEPVRLSMCHCLCCQQRTGSVFGVQARFPRERVKIEGASTAYSRVGDSGTTITFNFCATCGSTVYWHQDTVPDLIAVAVGAYADPNFPPPKVAVYEGRRHAWAVFPHLTMEHFG